jgi:hypothetical protein
VRELPAISAGLEDPLLDIVGRLAYSRTCRLLATDGSTSKPTA